MQDLARDSFGRRFADVGGDEWSIDTGQFPVITPAGVYVPPGGGAIPDEVQEARALGSQAGKKGLFVPTDPATMISNNVVRNNPLNTFAWSRFVPKQDYSIRAAAWILTTVPPAAPYTVHVAIFEWDAALDDAVKIASVARTSKAQTNINVYDFGADVPIKAGVPYWIGFWSDKTFNSIIGSGVPQTFMNVWFGALGGLNALTVDKPHPIFLEGFANVGGMTGITNLFAYINAGLPGPSAGGQITPNGFAWALREEAGNLPA